jgi:serine/threonine-protein kinase 24/25/MST4
MAPEVLRQDKHDGKADVWSLGITCIELVKGKPPLSHLPALQIVMRVPMNPPPKLDGDEFSDTFKDFISQCLQKNPDNRASIKDLLKHPFIEGAGENSVLQVILPE